MLRSATSPVTSTRGTRTRRSRSSRRRCVSSRGPRRRRRSRPGWRRSPERSWRCFARRPRGSIRDCTAGRASSSLTCCRASVSTHARRHGRPRGDRSRGHEYAEVLYLETPTNPTLKVTTSRAFRGRRTAAGATSSSTTRSPRRSTSCRSARGRPRRSTARRRSSAVMPTRSAVLSAAGGSRAARLPLPRDHGCRSGPRRGVPLVRGMKTLHLRVREQNANAMRIAEWLHADERVEGCSIRDSRRTKDTTSRGADARVRRDPVLRSVRWMVRRRDAAPKLRLAHRAANLGAVETIAGPPATTSHVECTPEERAALDPGVTRPLLRRHRGRRRPDRRPRPGAGMTIQQRLDELWAEHDCPRRDAGVSTTGGGDLRVRCVQRREPDRGRAGHAVPDRLDHEGLHGDAPDAARGRGSLDLDAR